jgi:hypothetical protein
MAPGLGGRHQNQPSIKYDDLYTVYQANGEKGQ